MNCQVGSLGRLSRPVYDNTTKTYTCDLSDGFRFETEQDDTVFTPGLDKAFEWYHESVVEQLLVLTKGWFSKPLTKDWLLSRIKFDMVYNNEKFEGTVVWQANKLIITKDAFLFKLVIVEQKKREPVIIDFEDGIDSVAPDTEVLSIGPTRRDLQKKMVMEARSKAARSLFKAERLTNEYISLYGEDTDWDESDNEDE